MCDNNKIDVTDVNAGICPPRMPDNDLLGCPHCGTGLSKCSLVHVGWTTSTYKCPNCGNTFEPVPLN